MICYEIVLFFIFLFFSFIFISWRLVTSQHWSGFCHTLTWISLELHIFSSPIPPPTSLSTRVLWVFPVHQARALVSCIPPGLVICFTIDNIHAVLSKHPTLAFSHRTDFWTLWDSFLFLLFNWTIIDIQYSISFRCKA